MMLKCIYCGCHLHAPFKSMKVEDLVELWKKQGKGDWIIKKTPIYEDENDIRFEGYCEKCTVADEDGDCRLGGQIVFSRLGVEIESPKLLDLRNQKEQLLKQEKEYYAQLAEINQKLAETEERIRRINAQALLEIK